MSEIISHGIALLLGVSIAANIALGFAILGLRNRVRGIGMALRFINKRKSDPAIEIATESQTSSRHH